MQRLTFAFACLAALSGPRAAFAADSVLPIFAVESFAMPRANPYFPLESGKSRTLKGVRTDGEPIVKYGVLTVQGPGQKILGVSTTTIVDEAFEDGRLVERTFDYFAADKDGKVWHFGEDVTDFRFDDAGKRTGTDTDSTWRAGMNGAKPGITMPGQAIVGLTLF